MFVSFEGLDGSGKTTQAELLAAHLTEQGHEVVLTREPGGTPLGEAIRALLLDGPEMTPWAEAALFAAARGELVERVIRPALDRGAIVVCDRYLDSSLAYQGIARGLGVERVLELNAVVSGDLVPDRTFLLDIDPVEAIERLGVPDRIEREADAFKSAVADAYRKLARRFPDRIVVLEATLPRDVLAAQVREQLAVRRARA
jgi:dTMP kinase